MALIFRKNQSTPLSNTQLDGNFEYLNEQLALKLTTANVTAEYLSTKLNTAAEVSAGVFQTQLQLCETNTLDAWTLRTLTPSYAVPTGVNKSSVVLRGTEGDIKATTFVGDLDGNAESATTAVSADTALSLSNTYTVPIARGGTGSNNAENARNALEVLHTGGGNSMTNKLMLAPASSGYASINFGVGQLPTFLENGDMWALSDALYYRVSNTNFKIAPTASPVFTGQPQAPDANGVSSQIATISHLNAQASTLNSSIALKANINSPIFTGTPSAPTPSENTNNTTLATTAFVRTAIDNKETDITSAYEIYTDGEITQLQNTINGLLNLKANINSPHLTGTPTTITPSPGDNSQRIATTAFTVDALNTLNSTIQSALSSLNALINSTRPVPAGSVFYIASTVVPDGYLECAGQAISKLTYPSLWQAMGSPATLNGDPANTFRLPDLRGEFIRGWDHGRGVDRNFTNTGSRELGSWQIGSLHIHNDEADAFTGGCWNNMWTNGSGYSHANDSINPYGNGHANELGYDALTFEWLGAYADTMTYGNFFSNYPSFAGTYEWRDGTINLNPGTTYRSNHWIFMSRPRNVALMPIIKY